MKKFLGNILLRLLLKADADLKRRLYDSLKNSHSDAKYLSYRRKYAIADTFRFNGLNIVFYGKGQIVCGENSYIGNYSTVQVSPNQKVVIGNNCSISHNVRIYTCSNKTDQDMNTIASKQKVFGDVIIGDGVWIGANVFIKEGITIGSNAIIGANSVVTKDLETDGVYGGIPAKLIRKKNCDYAEILD
ncbi:hypothetical protein FEDK69T_21510 [Flavobacterium enshiense DK69]|uniref:acyltransferase n=1 Tax=Flavobacterium enshiense TaxID=1341165 RepID=UPI0003C5A713|nr:acyltransferase [Flavobacterium enshiense]ESU22173.1 hypothetical protein FEDK69T_21510 [Flavobacterium enshiense DK69]